MQILIPGSQRKQQGTSICRKTATLQTEEGKSSIRTGKTLTFPPKIETLLFDPQIQTWKPCVSCGAFTAMSIIFSCCQPGCSAAENGIFCEIRGEAVAAESYISTQGRVGGPLPKPELGYVTLAASRGQKNAFFSRHLIRLKRPRAAATLRVGVFICWGSFVLSGALFQISCKIRPCCSGETRFVSDGAKTQHSSAQTQEMCNCLTPLEQHLTLATQRLPNNP